MNQKLHRIAFIFLVITAICIPTAFSMTGATGTQTGTLTGDRGVLVRFKSTSTFSTQSLSMLAAGCTHIKSFRVVPGLTYARISATSTLQDTLRTLRQDPNVLYAEPNVTFKVQATPNDPQFPSLYGLHNNGQSSGTVDADIDAPEAWDIETGNEVIVAVIDSGVDYNHEDLAANMWDNDGEIPDNGVDDDGNGFVDDYRGWDFANNDNDPMDDHFHGTHVAGTIAAVGNNGIGVVGVNWKARIMPLKFISLSGAGTAEAAVSAIDYAVMMGARISNNSWGGSLFSQALQDAIANAQSGGHLFVAAAGNEGSNNDVRPIYPASFELPNIISVAAIDRNDRLATFSNFGATAVDLGAPGVDILSTAPGNGYRTLSGTSMASPHVAGAAALLLAYNPGLTIAQLKAALLEHVDPIPPLQGKSVSNGRLNVFQALDSLGGAIRITPRSAKVARGASLQFTASAGTPPYQWSVDNNTVGNIDGNGLFTANAAGLTRISVSDSGALTGSSGDITVTQTTVAPTSAIMALGQSLEFTAAGGTAPYTWETSNTAVASVDSTGLVTAHQQGEFTVTATDANGIGDSSGKVRVAVSTLNLAPQTAVISMGATLQFNVTGAAPFTWSSANTKVASIDENGVLTAIGAGTTTVSVMDANGEWGISGVIEVRHIRIAPNTAILNAGDSVQFTAGGGLEPYAWHVSEPAIAEIDQNGLLTGRAGGVVTVFATDADGASGASGLITINGSGRLEVLPNNAVMQKGEILPFKVIGGFPPYRWSSSNPFVLNIDRASGEATAIRVGIAFVHVSDSRGNAASSSLINVREIQIFPQGGSLAVGQTLQFRATGGSAPYNWRSSNADVANIDNNGLLTALSAGTITVSVRDANGIEGASGTITVSNGGSSPSPGPLTISPRTARVQVGSTLQFTVQGGTAPYLWEVSNPFIARMDRNGLLTAVAPGTVLVSVRDAAGARDFTSAITLFAASTPTQPQRLTVSPATARLMVGDTLQMLAEGGTAPYSWTSLNAAVLSIDGDGLLTALSPGVSTVTVRDAAGATATTGLMTVNTALTGLSNADNPTADNPAVAANDEEPAPVADTGNTGTGSGSLWWLLVLTLFATARSARFR